ncbi:MAG: hypothetical protein ACRDC4_12230, partial [Plesiomonas sp.]
MAVLDFVRDVYDSGAVTPLSIGKATIKAGARGVADAFVENEQEQEAQARGVPAQQVYADHPSDPYELNSWKQNLGGNVPTNNYPTVQQEAVVQAKEAEIQQGEKPKVPNVNPISNPAEKVATATAIANNEVDTSGPPKAPSPNEIQTKEFDESGKQLLFKEIAHPNWYEDDSFYEGLLSFGLNLLSGNDWAQSFNAGAQVFQNSRGLEERQAWAQDLIAAGYDAHEVQAYIKTGDHKVLTDPREKQMREMEYQMAKLNYGEAQYTKSPEYLEWKRKMEEWNTEQDYQDRLLSRASTRQSMNLALRQDARAERELKRKE